MYPNHTPSCSKDGFLFPQYATHSKCNDLVDLPVMSKYTIIKTIHNMLEKWDTAKIMCVVHTARGFVILELAVEVLLDIRLVLLSLLEDSTHYRAECLPACKLNMI